MNLFKALEANKSLTEIDLGGNLIFSNENNKKILLNYEKNDDKIQRLILGCIIDEDEEFINEIRIINKNKEILFYK